MGPWTYAKHLGSGARLPFTAAYFGSIALTLYFAIGVSKSIYFACLFFLLPKKPACSWSPALCASCALPQTRSPPPIPSPMRLSLDFHLSHLALPHYGKYGHTAQPGKGDAYSPSTHRTVQRSLSLVMPAVGHGTLSSLDSSHLTLAQHLC